MINFKTNSKGNFMKFGKILKAYFLSFALVLTAQQTVAAQENKSAQEAVSQAEKNTAEQQTAQAGVKETPTLASKAFVKIDKIRTLRKIKTTKR